MARTVWAVIVVVLACVTVWHVAGCTMDTGRFFFYWDSTTKVGFGSDESETAPIKDGQLSLESQLGEDWVRSKLETGEQETGNKKEASNQTGGSASGD